MCEYCEKRVIIFRDEMISHLNWGWGNDSIKLNYTEACRNLATMGCFIDVREGFGAFLRYVDVDDCNCLDHGFRIEIKFCPFCGSSLGERG